MTDILVLPHKIHGLSAAEYAETLRERFPEFDVAHAETPAEERRLITEARVATGYEISTDLLAAAERLDLFVCTFAGTGHLPLEALDDHGVAVENASGVHGPNIAEQVLGCLLTFVRRLDRGWRQERRAEWRHYQAGELKGSTATVVGQGPIGETVVDRLQAFDVHTIGVRYTPSKGGPADEVVGFDAEALQAAFAETDHLVLACPLTDLTERLVDEQVFRTLPTDATLVNVARGEVVDTDALVDALRTNQIRGAALDVTDPEPLPPDSPLWSLGNCHVTPHNAGHTPEYWNRCADILGGALDSVS
ncbi:D-isomer specific 2-hydroxyacid dehydrogenase NAD-binding protein [Halosimplex carlsbadense 2-9-1]|uniref:D-isomer specific 2-hydroxyacid dehydrogenase NAD-binding protein n=1 Tax=Halosimplex carlsbadense 2-9-1 TaxID=797114 RepID=M0D8S9_9EURY|nr:D-2-hydroxyacid dehydrogenase [Halosimplex carlsbadense]ELZ30544.1 D-isomer specific 2-hydroxyacid dehydrogenase NAD-binding protein [Halosimplex carlsbadense 2-9-1]